jgi:hypothetical protein
MSWTNSSSVISNGSPDMEKEAEQCHELIITAKPLKMHLMIDE